MPIPQVSRPVPLLLNLLLFAPAFLPGQEDQLYRQIGQDGLFRLVEAAGHEVTDMADPDSDAIQVVGKTGSGITFLLRGTACSGGFCKGINMVASFNYPGTDPTEMANRLSQKYAAVSVWASGEGNLTLARYLILDHGQAWANLVLNIEVFTSIINSAYQEMVTEPEG